MDDIISDGEEPAAAVPAAVRPQRRPRHGQQQPVLGQHALGSLFLVLVICDLYGFWRTYLQCGSPPDGLAGRCVGIGLTRWELVRDLPESMQWLGHSERARVKANELFGYLTYPVYEYASLLNPVEVPSDSTATSLSELLRHELASMYVRSHSYFTAELKPVHELIQSWLEDNGVRKAPRILTLKLHPNFMPSLRHPSIFHVIGFARRLCRNRLISRKDGPKHKLLKSWFRTTVDPAADAIRPTRLSKPSGKVRKGQPAMHKIDLLLDWLDASTNVRNSRNIWSTAMKFSKVFASANSVSVAQVLGVIRPANLQTLRSARPRLDACACFMFRRIWEQVVPLDIDIYIYLDSSPQVRGEELFAASFEMRDTHGNYPWERRLMPMIALPKDFWDAMGKAVALVWMIFLLVGPAPAQVIRFCNRVRCIVSDMGTERKLARMADIVPEFFTVMLEVKVDIEPRQCLFPIAVASPGWMHGWDIILQRGLSSLSFFTVFLVGFRALVAFCRSKLWRGQLSRHLKSQGLNVVADMLNNVRMPSIAEWRWTTLAAACRHTLTIISTLANYLTIDIFGTGSGTNKTIRTVVNALGTVRFHVHLRMVDWFAAWVTELQSWGRGSAQRDHAKANHLDFDPLWNGRRLPEAGPHVESTLAQVLTECNSWTVDTFGPGCEHDLLVEFQAMVRGSVVLAQKRHAYLYKLPWLLARLLQPGVKALCIEQYLACENHHPLSDMFFSADGPLKPDVDALDESGQGASAELVRAVESIAAIPFDDSIGESPHALGNGIGRHARGSSFAWIASSMRLGQNLQDVRDWCKTFRCDITQEWLACTAVLQTKPARSRIPIRITPAEFRDRFYHMTLFCNELRQPVDDSDGIQAIADAPPDACLPGSNADAPPDNAPVPRARAPIDIRQVEQQQQLALMKEYFTLCLVPSSFISFTAGAASGDDSDDLRFVQILAIEPRVTVVDTCTVKDATRPLLNISVQDFSPMVPIASDSAAILARPSVDVFAFSDSQPEELDFGHWVPSDRRDFIQWTNEQSTMPGCVTLRDPCCLAPAHGLSLMDDKMPTLCILDALASAGWTGTRSIVDHNSESESESKLFDSREPMRRKNYFRCVLVIDQLFGAGILRFKSGRQDTYYRYLLKFKRLPPPDLSMKLVNDLIRQADDDSDGYPAILAPPPPAPLPVVPRDPDIFLSDDEPMVPAPVPAELPGPDSQAPEPEPIADADIVPELPEPEPAIPVPPADDWPATLEGMDLKKIAGRAAPGRVFFFSRLSIGCPNRDHVDCKKSRSTELMKAQLGPRAALCFLGCWAENSRLSKEEHARYCPTLADMRDYKHRKLAPDD